VDNLQLMVTSFKFPTNDDKIGLLIVTYPAV